jgi:hypothetical protein
LAPHDRIPLEQGEQRILVPLGQIAGFDGERDRGDHLARQSLQPVARQGRDDGIGERVVERAWLDEGVGHELGVTLPAQPHAAEIRADPLIDLRGDRRLIAREQVLEVCQVPPAAAFATQTDQMRHPDWGSEGLEGAGVQLRRDGVAQGVQTEG